MHGNVQLARAITSVFVRRLIKRIILLPAALLVVLFMLVVYMGMQVHTGWWAAALALIPPTLIVAGFFGLAWYATGKLSPRKLSRREARSISEFSSKLMAAAEQARTPLPYLAVKLVFDVLKNRDVHLLHLYVEQSRSLREEYARLKTSMS